MRTLFVLAKLYNIVLLYFYNTCGRKSIFIMMIYGCVSEISVNRRVS